MVYCGYGLSSCARGIVGSPSDDDRGMVPKYGFGTRCWQRRALRELFGGQLIQFVSGIPTRVIFDPVYATSTAMFDVSSR